MSATEERTIAVYVVDDHPVVRAGLRSMFEDYPHIRWAGAATDAATALPELAKLGAVVALVDLRLPGQDGCALCRQLKQLPRPPWVLMLTSFGEEADIVGAAASGADGYVLKTSEDEVLVAAITTVAYGGTVWPSFARKALLQKPGMREQTPLGLSSLSPQELRVLALVAEGKTNKEICTTFAVSEKTVRNQMSSLMRKLAVQRRAQAAAYYVRSAGTQRLFG